MDRYAQLPASPPPPKRGVTLVAPARLSLRDGNRLEIHGSFRVHDSDVEELEGTVMQGVVLIVRGSVDAAFQVGSGELSFADDTRRDGDWHVGFFNIELFSELGVDAAPMELWLSAAMFSYRSDVIRVEVVPWQSNG